MSGWTLQLLIDCDIAVLARCGRYPCDNSQELNLDRLKTKFGPDSSAMHKDLVSRIRCSKCGNDQIRLTYAPKSAKVEQLRSGEGPGAPTESLH